MIFDSIEKAICASLEGIPDAAAKGDWLWERTKWTREVKLRLCRLAKHQEIPFGVCATDCPEADYGEWLYDLCWYVENEVCLARLPLVAECEWSPEGACDGDFQKLMQAWGEHRLWVFEAKTPVDIDQMFRDCSTVVERFQHSQSGDRYLFAGVGWNPRSFRFHPYVQP